MILRVVGVDGDLYNGSVTKVSLPTENGIIGILPWHIALVTIVVAWLISYMPDTIPSDSLHSFADHTQTLSVSWWLAMVDNDVITVIAQ
jgi:F0F1-type ATP synthase epsilon subunit